jgi:hypothetical protein
VRHAPLTDPLTEALKILFGVMAARNDPRRVRQEPRFVRATTKPRHDRAPRDIFT